MWISTVTAWLGHAGSWHQSSTVNVQRRKKQVTQHHTHTHGSNAWLDDGNQAAPCGTHTIVTRAAGSSRRNCLE